MTKSTNIPVCLAQEGHQVIRGYNDNSLDRESCKQYALANGFKWQENKKNWNPSSADSVKGCYLFASNDNVYFNHHETGGQPCSTTMRCIQDKKPQRLPFVGSLQRQVRPDRQVALWRRGRESTSPSRMTTERLSKSTPTTVAGLVQTIK